MALFAAWTVLAGALFAGRIAIPQMLCIAAALVVPTCLVGSRALSIHVGGHAAPPSKEHCQ